MIRYLLEIQRMYEMQCEVLVKEFGVSPLIVAVAFEVWKIVSEFNSCV
ncbi:hypothetical protein LINGRAHAP2_LOCUS2146 [Linum grandiflorum]